MKDIVVGDEVFCYSTQRYARVEEVFPSAVCVKLVSFQPGRMRLSVCPQLWRAEEIENLSVCRYCGGRESLSLDPASTIPFRVCATCRTVLNFSMSEALSLSADD